MPFIQFPSMKEKTQGLFELVANNTDHTKLYGKNETFFAVPLEALVLFDNKNIIYKEIEEEELKRRLLAIDRSRYHHYETYEPERIYFDKKLPPAGYAQITFGINANEETRVREILQRYYVFGLGASSLQRYYVFGLGASRRDFSKKEDAVELQCYIKDITSLL